MPGAKGHETKELDIEEPDALVLASMELGNDPDAMEPDTGSEVLCHNLLAQELHSWLLLFGLSEESTGVEHAHLDRSDGISEIFWWKGLLSARNISIKLVLPFIFNSGGRIWDYRLNKDSLGGKGSVRGRSYIPETSLVGCEF